MLSYFRTIPKRTSFSRLPRVKYRRNESLVWYCPSLVELLLVKTLRNTLNDTKITVDLLCDVHAFHPLIFETYFQLIRPFIPRELSKH